MDTLTALHQTVRVSAAGVPTYGIEVPHNGAARQVAAAPRHAHREFVPRDGGVPRDTIVPAPGSRYGVRKTDILGATAPHDCRKHIRDCESESDAAARLMLDAPVLMPVAA